MFCKKCGSQITEGSLFCPVCGVKVDYSAPEQPAPEAKAVPAENDSVRGFATASLVMGILGICLPFIVFSILAVVFSSISTRKNGGARLGTATAGLVLGWVSLAISIIVIVCLIVFSAVVVTSFTDAMLR